MFEVLKIADLDERGALAFDLRDLLPLVAAEGATLHWAGIPLGAEDTFITGNDGPRGEEAFGLGATIDASEEGVPLEWEDLVDLSGSVLQTIWGTFVGVRDPAALAELPTIFNGDWRYVDRGTVRFYDLVEIALQAVDSSFWLVWAKDDALRARIHGAFSIVKTIPGAHYEPT